MRSHGAWKIVDSGWLGKKAAVAASLTVKIEP